MNEANRQDGNKDAIDIMIAMIEAEARRLAAGDFSAADKALAKQGLALDALFSQLAREAAEDIAHGHEPMGVALKAQSQCRMTLMYVFSSTRPRPATRAMRAFAKSHKQTFENGNRIG